MHRTLAPLLLVLSVCSAFAQVDDRKTEYVHAVTRGAGYMPWQAQGVSKAEREFRAAVENRKDAMFAKSMSVVHPVLLREAALERARKAIEGHDWAGDWFESHKRTADFILEQPDGYIEDMLSPETPSSEYGMTCPNCVGRKSQEGRGSGLMHWDRNDPEQLRCRECGQCYPDPAYPETAELVCPRTGQTFSFYLNEEERAHPDDRSGDLAWHWVGYPMHMSFSGVIRGRKARFMIRACESLAYTYAISEEPAYAAKAVAILEHLGHCYRNWLYHDYWNTVADCDPLYAAAHDSTLPLEWKRHL